MIFRLAQGRHLGRTDVRVKHSLSPTASTWSHHSHPILFPLCSVSPPPARRCHRSTQTPQRPHPLPPVASRDQGGGWRPPRPCRRTPRSQTWHWSIRHPRGARPRSRQALRRRLTWQWRPHCLLHRTGMYLDHRRLWASPYTPEILSYISDPASVDWDTHISNSEQDWREGGKKLKQNVNPFQLN